MTMHKFTELYIKEGANFISSYRLHAFYCVLHDIEINSLSLKKFMQEVKDSIKEVYNLDIKQGKKRIGQKTVRGIFNISVPLLTEQDYLEKILYVKQQTEQKRNLLKNKVSTRNNSTSSKLKNKTITGTHTNTEVTLKEYVTLCKPGTKNKKHIIPTNILYEDYKNFSISKEETSVSKFHFTNKFNDAWKEIYPSSPLTKGLRDPNDRNKRAVGYIQRVRSPLTPLKK